MTVQSIDFHKPKSINFKSITDGYMRLLLNIKSTIETIH